MYDIKRYVSNYLPEEDIYHNSYSRYSLYINRLQYVDYAIYKFKITYRIRLSNKYNVMIALNKVYDCCTLRRCDIYKNIVIYDFWNMMMRISENFY